MNLKRTTLIPVDDPGLAKSIFNAFIEKEMMILMIIIGDTKSVREAIPMADNLATLSYFNMERWVLWIRDGKVLETTLKEHLKASTEDHANADFGDIKCFCFSPIADEVAGIILKNGKLDYASLHQSFFRAQAHDIAITNS
ncbi:hypothetical protein FGM00_12930 [Aggregatimonas sangjinii]|uniref:Uncharacterized protein n=1 Tax=Aggregatimonas sangjinii TaxID=2583587 RepID=A0A5B7SVL1_9FLAO|nr:hypothetical protein [Aggregatimonas sangjinii]QCX00971.1 hypothetical protein FGM00_12930 [Aggregatimonas sangjinii]